MQRIYVKLEGNHLTQDAAFNKHGVKHGTSFVKICFVILTVFLELHEYRHHISYFIIFCFIFKSFLIRKSANKLDGKMAR